MQGAALVVASVVLPLHAEPQTLTVLTSYPAEVADNRPDFEANGREWRTPPLWGIGLAAYINEYQSYLHDGRAQSLTEAILWHDGEAEKFGNVIASCRKQAGIHWSSFCCRYK